MITFAEARREDLSMFGQSKRRARDGTMPCPAFSHKGPIKSIAS